MTNQQDGRNDFDFLVGSWNVHNRRLRERLKGSDSWEEFPGTLVNRKILGGMGNIEDVTMERASGLAHGFALRLFDLKSRQWSIYWADGISGIMGVPEIGSFKDGRGEFYAQELFEGRSILSRFIWSEISETSLRWEQAFSEDGGKTWETNWINTFARA
jgi:hypothetical protein